MPTPTLRGKINDRAQQPRNGPMPQRTQLMGGYDPPLSLVAIRKWRLDWKRPCRVAAMNPRFHGTPVGSSKTLMGVIGDWKADVEAAISRGEVRARHEHIHRQPPGLIDRLAHASFDRIECAALMPASSCGTLRAVHQHARTPLLWQVSRFVHDPEMAVPDDFDSATNWPSADRFARTPGSTPTANAEDKRTLALLRRLKSQVAD